MQSMPSLLDRRRLKDRIVESVSKAVKQIQEYQFSSDQADVVLTNHDWQFCKLVEHLDHAFLHGLRHITNGYWAVVQDFTHRATTQEVTRMASVTTNLGRGRAWLYLALTDHLLESYLHCFITNQASIKRFYVKEALVLDQQRMEILLTLAAGLEFITFQLDVDVPYLDLSSHMRPRLPSYDDSTDHISLCSMDSTMSQSSSVAELDSFSHGTDDRRPYPHHYRSPSFINEDEENADPQKPAPHLSTSTSMPVISGWDGSSRMERIKNMPTSASFTLPIGSTLETLEVIHVRAKPHLSSKKPRRMRSKRSDSDLEPDRLSLTSLSSVSSDASLQKKRTGSNTSAVASTEEGRAEGSVRDKGLCSPCVESDRTGSKTDKVVVLSTNIEWTVRDTLSITKTDTKHIMLNHDGVTAENGLNIESLVMEDSDEVAIYKGAGDDVGFSSVTSLNGLDMESGNTGGTPSAPDSSQIPPEGLPKGIPGKHFPVNGSAKEGHSVEENGGLCRNEFSKMNSSDSAAERAVSVAVTELLAESDSRSVDNDELSSPSDSDGDDKHPSEIKVDINFLLLLKLHVLQDDEEQLLKMYRTSVGHAEGEVQQIYLLVSSLALYLLTPTSSEHRLNVLAALPYNQIDYILLGVGDQIITIVCTNRRRQFWVTTGDENLTRHVISNVDRAIRICQRELPHLSVLTEPTQQRIALRKWAANESKLELHQLSTLGACHAFPRGDIDMAWARILEKRCCPCRNYLAARVTATVIYTYMLVYWCEVPSADMGSRTAPSKEGMLLVRSTPSLLSTTTWKPYYFMLKDGMLYQYADKHGGSPPKACVQLSGEECVGCRRSPHADRPNCFELILSDDSVLQLSARDAQDTQDWLLALCQAVAEGMQSPSVGEDCLACCCIVTQTKLLMCHEDVQTNFFRTLGKADITDVTAVFTDPVVNTYLVIAFETHETSVTSEFWTLFFNAKGEQARFLESLGQAWSKHFKVALPVSELADIAMVKQCREGQARIQRGAL